MSGLDRWRRARPRRIAMGASDHFAVCFGFGGTFGCGAVLLEVWRLAELILLALVLAGRAKVLRSV